MKPSQLKRYLKALYKNRKPKPFIAGQPGCGKTSIVYQLFRDEMKVPVYVFQAMLYDPVEVKGLPVFDHATNSAKFLKFEDMPEGKEGVLFIDDLPHAPNQTQNAFMRVILEGIAGAWNIGGLFPIAAGNRAMHHAGAKDLQTALANRFEFIDFEIDYDDWRDHAVRADFAPQVIAYLGTPYGREWLSKFEANKQINPTPRSWEFASDNIKMLGLSDSLTREALMGCIGEEAASKFLGWVKVYDKLPDLQEIMAGKNLFSEDLDVMYAVVSGLVGLAKNHPKKKASFQRLVDYSCAMPDGFVELAVWLSRDLAKLDRQTFIGCNLNKWANKFPDLVTETES